MNWHFDRSEFTTTLLLQKPLQGGDFEYSTNLRSDDDPNYDGVARLLSGQRPQPAGDERAAGHAERLRGKNTAHRVTTVGGKRDRMIAVFSITSGRVCCSAPRNGWAFTAAPPERERVRRREPKASPDAHAGARRRNRGRRGPSRAGRRRRHAGDAREAGRVQSFPDEAKLPVAHGVGALIVRTRVAPTWAMAAATAASAVETDRRGRIGMSVTGLPMPTAKRPGRGWGRGTRNSRAAARESSRATRFAVRFEQFRAGADDCAHLAHPCRDHAGIGQAAMRTAMSTWSSTRWRLRSAQSSRTLISG